VLSSSNLAVDKSTAYEQGAAGYLLKADLDKNFFYLVRFLECYQAMVEFPVA
jgi:hypothetical protein